ncbi:hypothetical protein [Nocardioides pantholopis]|uniref:hypothetical protein n=1 Tax=Nocardioides pantholopis TaxID=2483798 RepID=UPI000FDB9A0F|nr:hypothetical protein [Nocardioides pantholopis]
MNGWIMAVVLALTAVAAGSVIVLLIRDRTAGDPTFAVLALAELALLVQMVVGLVALGGTEREVPGVTFVSYLISIVLVLPIGAFWSLAERTRAGTAVLLVALLTVVALEVRLHSLWSGGA